MVAGDSVWDLLAARRAGCLGIGLLSGGYGKEELKQVGAYRVYQDPAELLTHLDEVGIRIVGKELKSGCRSGLRDTRSRRGTSWAPPA
jgi:hypothetical protein